jgi:adenine nucleotide transporter 17
VFLTLVVVLQAVNASTAAEARYHGVLDAVAKIVQAEGVVGLFKGLQAKLLQTVLGAAVLMAVKERLLARAMRHP